LIGHRSWPKDSPGNAVIPHFFCENILTNNDDVVVLLTRMIHIPVDFSAIKVLILSVF